MWRSKKIKFSASILLVAGLFLGGNFLIAGTVPVKKTETTNNESLPSGDKMMVVSKDMSKKTPDDILYTMNFSDKGNLSALDWLKKNGFKLESAASNPDKMQFEFKNNSLVLTAKTCLFALALKPFEKEELKGATSMRLVWGVNKYPIGASYEKGINNEPIMLYVYYGSKKMPSGSWFIPDAPYFIGYYLGETDPVGKYFVGNHFSEGGRFTCVANPKEGKMITTEIDLDKAFKTAFHKKKMPVISAFALEVETSNTGPSQAFIKKIEFLK